MAYKLLTEIGWEDGYYRRYYCQSSADLTSLPTSPTIAIGSEAVLENGAVYRLSNANTWLIFTGAATLAHTVATIGATTGAALAANAARKYALLVNDSDSVIYVKIGAAAVLNQGIRLNAYGGSYEMSARDGNLDVRAINAISSGAGKILLVTEGT